MHLLERWKVLFFNPKHTFLKLNWYPVMAFFYWWILLAPWANWWHSHCHLELCSYGVAFQVHLAIPFLIKPMWSYTHYQFDWITTSDTVPCFFQAAPTPLSFMFTKDTAYTPFRTSNTVRLEEQRIEYNFYWWRLGALFSTPSFHMEKFPP